MKIIKDGAYVFRLAWARALKLNRIPPWVKMSRVEKARILSLYVRAQKKYRQTGVKHQVDHVIPLNGRKVSGLHCSANLQIIPKYENAKKSNSFTPLFLTKEE